jgi:hypothetical protein
MINVSLKSERNVNEHTDVESLLMPALVTSVGKSGTTLITDAMLWGKYKNEG